MDKTMRKATIFYVSAIVFTWICWLVPIVYTATNNIPLYYNEGVYTIVTGSDISTTQIILFLTFALAPYGPLFGVWMAKLMTRTRGAEDNRENRDRNHIKWLLLILLYPIVVFGTAFLITTIMMDLEVTFYHPLFLFGSCPSFSCFS